MKNFERKMLEEKGLINEILEFEVDCINHTMPVEVVVEFIENIKGPVRKQIRDQFSKIDFVNGDLLDYITFLGKGITQL